MERQREEREGERLQVGLAGAGAGLQLRMSHRGTQPDPQPAPVSSPDSGNAPTPELAAQDRVVLCCGRHLAHDCIILHILNKQITLTTCDRVAVVPGQAPTECVDVGNSPGRAVPAPSCACMHPRARPRGRSSTQPREALGGDGLRLLGSDVLVPVASWHRARRRIPAPPRFCTRPWRRDRRLSRSRIRQHVRQRVLRRVRASSSNW